MEQQDLTTSRRTGLLSALIVLGVITGCVISAAVMGDGARASFVREWGPLENITLGVLFIGALLLIFRARRNPRMMIFSAFFLLLIAAREMDVQSAFTTGGVERTRYYVDPEVPLWEKGVVILVFIALGFACVVYFRDNWSRFCAGLARKEPVAWLVLGGIVCYVLGKCVDSVNHFLAHVGLSFADGSTLKRAFEESIELGGATAFMLAAAIAAFGRTGIRESAATVSEAPDGAGPPLPGAAGIS